MMCAHGGSATQVASNVRVKANGNFVAVMSDEITLAGCGFTVPPGVPTPCIAAKFMTPAKRVKIGGVPAVLATTTALTTGMGPPVPLVVTAAQKRATAT
jgi:hypothetical protein